MHLVCAAAILPNHSKPYLEEIQETRALSGKTQEFIVNFDEKLKKLEEEEGV
ncbi:unnamed protein product [Arabis nemorensis]|uniref:Uncharacterized protein n=1 Tax=Arabis nemorensis TaxID=586526 RepID=A0A565BFL8_9BRAS|nr:unnamed protein product [Arabis nemorensis]